MSQRIQSTLVILLHYKKNPLKFVLENFGPMPMSSHFCHSKLNIRMDEGGRRHPSVYMSEKVFFFEMKGTDGLAKVIGRKQG